MELCGDLFDKVDDPKRGDYDPNAIVAHLLHELIHAVGGNEIDAVSIVAACFPNGTYETPSDYEDDIKSYCIRLLSSTNEKIVHGKYTVWNPSTGTVSKLGTPGTKAEANIGMPLFTKTSPLWNRGPNYTNKLTVGGDCT